MKNEEFINKYDSKNQIVYITIFSIFLSLLYTICANHISDKSEYVNEWIVITINILTPIAILLLSEKFLRRDRSNSFKFAGAIVLIFGITILLIDILMGKTIPIEYGPNLLLVLAILDSAVVVLLVINIRNSHTDDHIAYLAKLIGDNAYWKWVRQHSNFKEKFIQSDFFDDENIIEDSLVGHDNKIGLFLTNESPFPEWDISFCNKTKRILFSIEGYFNFFQENTRLLSSIHAAITVIPVGSDSPSQENQEDFFSKIIENDGYVGFIIYGEQIKVQQQINNYQNLLNKLYIKNYSKSQCKFFKFCLITLNNVGMTLNSGYLVKNTENGKTSHIIGIDGLADKTRKLKVAVTKPKKLAEDDQIYLINEILDNFPQEIKTQFLEEGTTNIIDKINSIDWEDIDLITGNLKLSLSHLRWLLESRFITEDFLKSLLEIFIKKEKEKEKENGKKQ